MLDFGAIMKIWQIYIIRPALTLLLLEVVLGWTSYLLPALYNKVGFFFSFSSICVCYPRKAVNFSRTETMSVQFSLINIYTIEPADIGMYTIPSQPLETSIRCPS